MENAHINADEAINREIISSRVFNTTADQIFAAWTDPKRLAKWWGPNGFSNTFHEFDLKPGGHWKFTMHGPNGIDYRNESVFVELEPTRIILDHVSWPKFRLIATFDQTGTQTKLNFRQVFNSVDDYQKVKAIAVPANEENFDRLEAVLGLR